MASLLLVTGLNAQGQKTPSNKDIVTKFLNGFNDPTQIESSLALLADDYRFKNPMVTLNSKTEFIQLAQNISTVLTGLEIIKIAEVQDWLAVLYVFKSKVDGLESNIATEWFRVENGIIKESHLIYDASEWRKFYENMKH